MTSQIDSASYWIESASLPRFPKLERDGHAEVVVVGGGITGLTAAYLLTAAGRSCVLLERGRCAQIDTGHTSAHLTMVTDTRLTDLVKRFGRDHAQAVWDAGLAAIAQIDAIASEEPVDCEFARVPGYLHAPRQRSPQRDNVDFEAEARLAETWSRGRRSRRRRSLAVTGGRCWPVLISLGPRCPASA